MSDYRWQGHSHEELFQQINEGPGADGSSESIRRWQQLTRTLNEVDNGLADALASAMSGWNGEAADSAHEGLHPLGAWARQAQEAADLMRDRAEQQAEFVSKARNDMPAPVAVSAEDPGTAQSMLTHLVGAQTDYEVQESHRNAAEQQAFAVMRGYESSTTANTTSLASFTPPPQVVVDSPSSSGSPGAAGVPGASGTPGSAGSAGASSGSQGITISWGGVPAKPMPSPRVGAESGGAGGTAAGGSSTGSNTSRGGSDGRANSFRGVRTSGSTVATGESSSTGGSASAGSPTSSTTANSATSPPRGAAHNQDDASDEAVDQNVTEERGGSGGLFDEPRTPSRPVIGGQPD